MKQYLKITTKQPLIMTSSSATQGGLQTLDYITASSLLGLAASKIYAKLDKTQAWQAFHNGDVQFSNAYPLVDGMASIPVPASLHYEKDTDWSLNDLLNVNQLSNHCAKSFQRDGEVQYKQCRDGFISATGQVVNVKQTVITKTALDDQQTAKDGQLFNYQAIDSEQSFVAAISGDDFLVEQIVGALVGTQRLGRSRSSEFGKVLIEKCDEPFEPVPTSSDEHLVILCLNDLEALDRFGEPTLTPELSELIDGAHGTLDTSCSFIRSHSISLFNRARGGFDGEHHLITKGSILVFNEVKNVDFSALSRGLGINNQLGFGQVWINPSWLEAPELTLPLFKSAQQQSIQVPEVDIVYSPLIRFISNLVEHDEQLVKDKQVAHKMIQQSVNAYHQARRYNHIINAYNVGPSSSQLRRVAEVYRSGETKPLKILFDGEHAICKAKNDEQGWGVSWDNGERFISFSDAFELILTNKSPKQVELFIEQLCRYEPSQFNSLNKLVKEQNLEKTLSLPEAN